MNEEIIEMTTLHFIMVDIIGMVINYIVMIEDIVEMLTINFIMVIEEIIEIVVIHFIMLTKEIIEMVAIHFIVILYINTIPW